MKTKKLRTISYTGLYMYIEQVEGGLRSLPGTSLTNEKKQQHIFEIKLYSSVPLLIISVCAKKNRPRSFDVANFWSLHHIITAASAQGH